jgi:hypothetical protein
MPFTRRYAASPSAAELVKVSGIVIVDSPPPVAAGAAAFGKICLVGEFEDGPFATPTDILTSADQATIFGGFGFQVGTVKNQNACAKSSGGSELWNGNAWVQSAKLKFGGLTMCRVDTSVGQVALTPRAYVQGTTKAPFVLAAGQTLLFNPNATGVVTATFAAAAATVTAVTGTYTSFVGGETLVLALDQQSSFTVTFQAGDNTLAAIISRINLVYGQVIASNASSQLKLTSTKLGTGSQIIITAGAAVTTLGLTAATTNGTGDAVDITAVTQAEVVTKLQAASALVSVTTSAAGFPRIVSKLSGTGTIQVTGGTATGLGFAVGATATTAALPAAVSVPAGTRCYDGSTTSSYVLVMQTTAVAKGFLGTVSLKVRPAVDDGTYAGYAAASITTMLDKPGDYEWGVTNPALTTAALTAAQLDSVYLTAIAACQGVGNDTTKKINGIVSARTSNTIRAAIRQNAIDTSANGHYGRRAFICPPNGTSAAVIIGASAPGVSVYRDETCSYVAGGVAAFLQELIDGGYSTTGQLVRHPDVMMASRWSVLQPGFNPGQLPEDGQYRFDQTLFYGLETAAQAWTIDTYAAFKTAGVCGVEFDKDTGIMFEQGITAVDPSVDPSRVNISRKTLADYIGDSLTGVAKFQVKRQGTRLRREQLRNAFEGFLSRLAAPIGQLVDSFDVKYTTDGMPANSVLWTIAVNPTQSDDVIVFNLKVGANAVALATK